jgi:metallo-beta-lactamase class B
MKKTSRPLACLAALLVGGCLSITSYAQNAPPDHPAVVINGKTYTPRSILARNQGKDTDKPGGDMVTQMPPKKIIGNVYYVGTRTLGSYLIVTSAGNILINSMYDRTVVPVTKKSIEELGFKFSDIKFVLNNHEHNDHAEGDAKVKELTGAQIVEMEEGIPGLKRIKPNGMEHPIDRIIHDGDTVTLGDTALTAHLTAGHAHGGTTWTMQATEGGKTYDVVFFTSVRAPGKITPEVAAEFDRTFPLLRALPCDVPLGDHTEEYLLQEKMAKLKPGGPNPFIDPAGCNLETDIEDSMYHAVLQEQEQASK